MITISCRPLLSDFVVRTQPEAVDAGRALTAALAIALATSVEMVYHILRYVPCGISGR